MHNLPTEKIIQSRVHKFGDNWTKRTDAVCVCSDRSAEKILFFENKNG